MENSLPAVYDQLCAFVRQTALIESIQELLGWDERTMMPPAAGEYRAEQITYLSGLVHRRRTDPQIGAWLNELADSPLAADPHSPAGTTIRQLRRDYEKRCKLPQTLVEELTRACVLGQQAWTEARRNDDFASFQPHLERIYHLKRQQAEAAGYADEPYDALLDDFEPEARTADVAGVLAGLREELMPLVAALVGSSRKPHRESFAAAIRWRPRRRSANSAAAAIGFDFQRGRLDVTHHPFCSGMGPHDCRITTRYDEHFFPSAFFGILHEAGHGMYDQGLPTEHYGLPPGSYRVAGHPRVAVAAVGKPRRPQPGVLAVLLSRWRNSSFPMRWPTCRWTISTLRSTTCGRADPRRSGRGDVQPAHHHPLRIGAGAAARRPGGRGPARRVAREVPRVLGHRAAERRRRRAAGHPLERRADRLLPDVLAGQSVRRAVLSAGRRGPGRRRRRCWPAANSRRCCSGCATASTPAASAIRRPNWSPPSPASRCRTSRCWTCCAASSSRCMGSEHMLRIVNPLLPVAVVVAFATLTLAPKIGRPPATTTGGRGSPPSIWPRRCTCTGSSVRHRRPRRVGRRRSTGTGHARTRATPALTTRFAWSQPTGRPISARRRKTRCTRSTPRRAKSAGRGSARRRRVWRRVSRWPAVLRSR